MKRSSCRARFIGLGLPQPNEIPRHDIERRLIERLRKSRGEEDRLDAMLDAGTLPSDLTPEAFDALFEPDWLTERDRARIRQRTNAYLAARARKLRQIAHLKPEDRKGVLEAAHHAQSLGCVSRDAMEERIAALHAAFPWFAPASTAVMTHMRLRTASGPAPFHTPPLLLHGRPGIGKSAWARALSAAFGVPSVEVDVGASQGATFTLSGTERGWNGAHSGRVVQAMLTHACANPLVVIDEIDKIPEQVASSNKGQLPGALEVLKGMIEPVSARSWTCPALQIPFDLTGVSWVMTTNSIAHLPEAFLDRCKVVAIPDPSTGQLIEVAYRMIARHFPEHLRAPCAAALADTIQTRAHHHRRTSLRQLEQMCAKLRERIEAPMLQ